ATSEETIHSEEGAAAFKEVTQSEEEFAASEETTQSEEVTQSKEEVASSEAVAQSETESSSKEADNDEKATAKRSSLKQKSFPKEYRTTEIVTGLIGSMLGMLMIWLAVVIGVI